MADFFYGKGDNIPVVRATLKVDDVPYDLTGYTGATIQVARQDLSGAVDVRPVTPDPDQVANPGVVTFTFFDVGAALIGIYEARIKILDALGNQISFDGDRLITIEVTRDPGDA